MRVKCYMLEPTDPPIIRVGLRRYASGDRGKCPGPMSYHDAITPIGDVPGQWQPMPNSATGRYGKKLNDIPEPPHEDPSWPRRCGCGYEFADDDAWQVFDHLLYKRSDTGELLRLRDAGPGAMWDAWWYGDTPEDCGPDGKALICVCPCGHHWHIDGRASNCTLPDDKVHKCWVRHGVPPDLTVDKAGVTCAAGAGSIQTPKWHGFLTNGWLQESR